MKRWMLILALAALIAPAPAPIAAQVWHSTNQVTLAWDPVPMPVGADGKPLPGTVAYDVYSVGANSPKTSAALISRVTTAQAIVGFGNEGKYYLGVRTVRVISQTEEIASDISWSDDPLAVKNGETFGVVHYIKLPTPHGLRLQ